MGIEEVVSLSRASIEKEDLRRILEILTPRNPKRILEIGTWKGYSAEVWIKAFDPDFFLTIEKDQELEIESLPETRKNQAFVYLRGDSHSEDRSQLIGTLCPEVDFLFIDGDHSYEGVKKDYEMYGPLVKEGGVIVFHDALYHADKTEEVDIFWNELKEGKNYQEFKLGKNSTGVGVLFK